VATVIPTPIKNRRKKLPKPPPYRGRELAHRQHLRQKSPNALLLDTPQKIVVEYLLTKTIDTWTAYGNRGWYERTESRNA